jgi:hypothetical protein
MSDHLKLMTASGQLGYGIPVAAFEAALQEEPELIGADMGSIDPGPYYLGSGQLAAGDAGIRHDLDLVLKAGLGSGTQVLIGNAGTAGRSDQLDRVLAITENAIADAGFRAKIARLDTEVDKDLVRRRLHAGRVRPMPNAPALTTQNLDETDTIVAQVGPEGWAEALHTNPDVVIAGRSLDTAIFSAFAIERGFDRGLATHAGKIIECTSLAATPPGRDAAIAELTPGYFDYHSCGSDRRSTPSSVAAHAFYEQADPSRIAEPGGYVDLTEAAYAQLDPRTVRVSGSKWIAEPGYWVKLEGARLTGWRAICVAGVVDPLVIAERAAVEAEVQRAVLRIAGSDDRTWRCRLVWSGTARSVDPGDYPAMVMIDVVARSADAAHSLCGAAKQYLLHADYPGMVNNGGNVAFPFSPEVVSVGPSYEFSVYHLMELDDPAEVGVLSRQVVEPVVTMEQK